MLVLHRVTRRPTPATLYNRETELRLTDDGRYVTLSRYVERYGDLKAHGVVFVITAVSVRPSHLPNSSIKGDGVRIF